MRVRNRDREYNSLFFFFGIPVVNENMIHEMRGEREETRFQPPLPLLLWQQLCDPLPWCLSRRRVLSGRQYQNSAECIRITSAFLECGSPIATNKMFWRLASKRLTELDQTLLWGGGVNRSTAHASYGVRAGWRRELTWKGLVRAANQDLFFRNWEIRPLYFGPAFPTEVQRYSRS